MPPPPPAFPPLPSALAEVPRGEQGVSPFVDSGRDKSPTKVVPTVEGEPPVGVVEVERR